MKNVAPHFGPASVDFHLNRPAKHVTGRLSYANCVGTVSFTNRAVNNPIQMHIVPPPPAGFVAPRCLTRLASVRTAPDSRFGMEALPGTLNKIAKLSRQYDDAKIAGHQLLDSSTMMYGS